MKRFRTIFALLRQTSLAFANDNGFKLSASLSYYTVFALGPMLLIIISMSGLILRKEDVQGKVYEQLAALLGTEAAGQIQDIILSAQNVHATLSGAIIGFVILFIGATSLS